MFTNMTRTASLGALTAAALTLAPQDVSALGISITTDFANLGAAQDNFNDTRNTFENFFVTEDFEDFSLGQKGSGLDTGTVGTFNTAGGTGTGNSAVGGGTNVAVRDENTGSTGGRINTSDGTGDTQYLDSNDTFGIVWVASDQSGLGREFDRLLFTLTDPADQRKTLTISSTDEDGNVFTFSENIAPPTDDGQIFNILISFTETVSSATVTLQKSELNDGFSIDSATIGAVPLPAAAWLLLGVSGALVAAKRRSARRAA